MATIRPAALAVLLAWAVPCLAQTAKEKDSAKGEDTAAKSSSPRSSRTGNVLGPEGANVLLVIQAPAVQEELKLTAEQKTEVFDIYKEMTMKGADLFRASVLGGANDPEALFAAWSRFRQENEKAVGEVLKPKQTERLQQIVYRIEGPLSVSRPEVSARIKVKPDQYERISQIVNEWRLGQRQVVALARQATLMGQADAAQGPALRRQAAMIRDTASGRIGAILSKGQKDAFNALLGEPFDLAKIDPSLAEPPSSAASKGSATPSSKSKSSRSKKKSEAKAPDDPGGR